MTRQERAKQFMAFDAMKGLQEALRDREERHSRVEKHDISEEQTEKNSAVFARLFKGSSVRVECWHAFHDVTLSGTVSDVSLAFGYLTLGGERIYFTDVYSVQLTGA